VWSWNGAGWCGVGMGLDGVELEWGWMVWSSNSGKNKVSVSSPKRSYRFRAPLNLVLFTQFKAVGSKFDHSLPSIAKIKKELNC
jgi:hypothetical protein